MLEGLGEECEGRSTLCFSRSSIPLVSEWSGQVWWCQCIPFERGALMITLRTLDGAWK